MPTEQLPPGQGSAITNVPQAETSPTARRIARTILNGFDAYFADFQNMTLGAKARFETADWHGIMEAHTDRLDLYKFRILQLLKLVRGVTSKDTSDLELWREARTAFAQLVKSHINYEIAESFFNSIFCALFDHHHIHDRNLFVLPSRPLEEKPVPEYSIYITYSTGTGIEDLMGRILDDFAFSVPWENRERDIASLAAEFNTGALPLLGCPLAEVRIDILESIFYRNKAGYIVGRAIGGGKTLPLLMPCRNNQAGGIYVDTLIFEPSLASIVFGFTRAYFMVDTAIPSRFVRFVNSFLPGKSVAEIYNALGFNKHGKTEFYRDMIAHLRRSDDLFVTAPGIKGMVMTVFTLPSYGVVFKVIKDRFDQPKTVTEAIVRDKYKLVSRSDKAGRMADTQEYTNFIFYRNRFSEELIDELLDKAPSKIIIRDKLLIIRHLYVERRMTPLNIFLSGASGNEIQTVMDDYGNAIRQLAAANIFPGDMLLKNFGVTRHSRVVFYDYDEICLLTECNFRKIPEPRNELDEFAERPWYPVAENDIFPEEFRLFFTGNPAARKAFESLHADLYDYRYWQKLQQDINDGIIADTFPYRSGKRFSRQQSAGLEASSGASRLSSGSTNQPPRKLA